MKKLLFITFIFSNLCFADIYATNDQTLDTGSQSYLVGATYKICGITNDYNIAGVCIGEGIISPLIYNGIYQIPTPKIPAGYQIVIQSISVYDNSHKLVYTQQVQTAPSPNLCTVAENYTLHLGAYVPKKMVACNGFNYPQGF